jgi:2',3'-cyclic-nucleotide 2'-phosphodiesterase/3'-nucleotidase
MRTAAMLLLPIFAAQAQDRVEIQVLATTDMHGRLMAWDYFAAKPVAGGLTRLATLIRQQRAANPNTLLIDIGDTIEGTPLVARHHAAVAEGSTTRPDPMMLAMNHLGFDAMTVGNHEYNFGLKVMNRSRDDARFPWLSANTAASGAARRYEPFILKTVAGAKVGIFGITTPAIPEFEKPENYAGYRFEEGVAAARRAVEALRSAGADLVIGAVHAGQGGTFENMADSIAREVPGVDAIVFGHTHRDVADLRINGVLMIQPGRWADRLGVADFSLERQDGRWRVAAKQGRLLKPELSTAEAPDLLALAKPYHDAAEAWLSTQIATVSSALDGARGRIEDSALVDLIHEVQMHYAQAPVSLAALFNTGVRVPPGPVTIRTIAALYIYENELYGVETTGAVLKRALEKSAEYFHSCRTADCAGPLINAQVPGFGFDMAQGIEYQLDLSKPVGARITNVHYQGQPLRDDQPLRVALNNYRAAGEIFRNEKIVYRSNRQIRDLLVEYVAARKRVKEKPDGNWRIEPESARRLLQAEVEKRP